MNVSSLLMTPDYYLTLATNAFVTGFGMICAQKVWQLWEHGHRNVKRNAHRRRKKIKRLATDIGAFTRWLFAAEEDI